MRKAWILFGVAMLGCGGGEPSAVEGSLAAARWKGLAPTGQPAMSTGTTPPPPNTSGGIEYHGGPIMPGAANVYLIWYGNWTGDTGTTIIPAFLNGLNGSPYWAINSTYYDGTYAAPSSGLVVAGQYFDTAPSSGTSINMSSISAMWTIVNHAIGAAPFAVDNDGIYLILTAPSITDSSYGSGTGFCGAFCGWHAFQWDTTAYVKFGVIGDPSSSCPCRVPTNTTVSPNGNPGADAMVSVIAHELSETITDPLQNGWYHLTGGGEDGDLCAWNFGTQSAVGNGSMYNVTLGGAKYLTQQIQSVGAGGGCKMSYP